MKTYTPTLSDIKRDWYVVDVEGQTLGRIASQIANRLRGKHKPEFAPHMDNGDFIVVVNASKIKVTGTKLNDKKYYNYSGYPGGLRTRTLAEVLARKPEEVIIKAVRGMLPKNRLSSALLKKLKVYAGSDHPHQAQNPQPLELSL
jgi:large subunit ribosomal protein L13